MKQSFNQISRPLTAILVVVMLSACSLPKVAQQGQSALASSQPSSTPIAQPSASPPTFQTQPQLLGFSTDSKYFMHLESWRDTGAGIPHAALEVVNLPTNTCVAQGCLKTNFSESQAEQSLKSAENNLLQKTQPLRQKLGLMSPAPGTPLPVLTQSRSPEGTETITVQLQNQQPLQLTLKQKRVMTTLAGGAAEKDHAAMQLEIRYDGKTRSLGSLKNWQPWVLDFSIQEVRQSPDGKTIAILVTAAERTFEGTLGRTRVQGFAL